MAYKRVDFYTKSGKHVVFKARTKGRLKAKSRVKTKARTKSVRGSDVLTARW